MSRFKFSRPKVAKEFNNLLTAGAKLRGKTVIEFTKELASDLDDDFKQFMLKNAKKKKEFIFK